MSDKILQIIGMLTLIYWTIKAVAGMVYICEKAKEENIRYRRNENDHDHKGTSETI